MIGLRNRRGQTVVTSAARQARVIRQLFTVRSKIELIIRLPIIARAQNQLRFAIPLKSRSRHNVEDAIGADTHICRIAAALHLKIVDVLGIYLRAKVAGDICIRNLHAVNLPT